LPLSTKKSTDSKLLLEDIKNSEKEMADSPKSKKKKKGFCNLLKSIFKRNKVPMNVDDNDKAIDNYDKMPTEEFPRADR